MQSFFRKKPAKSSNPPTASQSRGDNRDKILLHLECIEKNVENCTREAQAIYDMLEDVKQDRERIMVFASERKFGVCLDIAQQNGWVNAARHFKSAQDFYFLEDRSDDEASRALYAIDVHLKSKKAEYKELERKCMGYTQEEALKKTELRKLLPSGK